MVVKEEYDGVSAFWYDFSISRVKVSSEFSFEQYQDVACDIILSIHLAAV